MCSIHSFHKSYFYFIIISFLLGGFLAAGCDKKEGNKQESVSFDTGSLGREAGGTEVGFSGTLTGYSRTQVSGSSAVRSAVRAAQNIKGELTIKNLDDASVVPANVVVSVSFDTETWQVTINRKLSLTPAMYQFDLLIEDGSFKYVGKTTWQVLEGQEIPVPLTITPVLGDQSVSVDQVTRLSDVTFEYPAHELSRFMNPQLGVIADGGQETLVGLNKTTGKTEASFSLTKGTHTIQLKFYEASIQKGKSNPVQEAQTIVPGQAFKMDLIALRGSLSFTASETGGDAPFSATFPQEVVDEAKGLDNLKVMASITGPKNPYQQRETTLVQEGGKVKAGAVFSTVQYDTLTVALEFFDRAQNKLLGSCLTSNLALSSLSMANACHLTLKREAVVGGNLLATVSLYAVDQNGLAVAGGTVIVGGETVAVTDAGGQALFYTISGASVTIKVTKGGDSGEINAALAPLGVSNETVVLFPSAIGSTSGGSSTGGSSTGGSGFTERFLATGREIISGTPSGSINPYYSDNGGKTWIKVNYEGTNLGDRLFLGNGRFIAHAQEVSYSDNGVTWLPATNEDTGGLGRIAYGNDRFVAASTSGSKTIHSVDNGVTWKPVNNARSVYGNGSIAFGNGRFVFYGGNNESAYSDDSGVTWTTSTHPGNSGSVIFVNGRFVTIGDGNGSYSDNNGESWTLVNHTLGNLSMIASGNNRLVAVGMGGNAGYSEDNGATWKTSSIISGTTAENSSFGGLTFGGENFMVTGSTAMEGGYSFSAVSPDGATWSVIKTSQGIFFTGLSFKKFDSLIATVEVPVALPIHQAEEVSFIDTNPTTGQMSGTVIISKASDESDITHYKAYLGSSPIAKLFLIADLPKTGGNLEIPVPENSPYPLAPGATHILVFTRNAGGEMETGVSVQIVDAGAP